MSIPFTAAYSDDLSVGQPGGETYSVLQGTETYDTITISPTDQDLGIINVKGTTSVLVANTGFEVGQAGNGTLNLSGGGGVETTTLIAAGGASSLGTVSIDGTDSKLTVSSGLQIGRSGNGILSLTNSGSLQIPSLEIAVNAGSVGAMNIGGDATSSAIAPGIINDDATVSFGQGTGEIVFNHTINDAGISFANDVAGTGTILAIQGTTTLSGTIGPEVTLALQSPADAIDGDEVRIYVTGTFKGGVMLFEDVIDSTFLGGTGTVGSVVISSSGTIAPTMPDGTYGALTISNGASFNNLYYEVQLDSSGGSDTLHFESGEVIFKDGIFLTINPRGDSAAYPLTVQYPIMTSNTPDLSGGSLADLQVNSDLLTQVVFSTNAMTVSVSNESVPVTSVARTHNQRAVATAIDELRVQAQEQFVGRDLDTTERLDIYSPLYTNLLLLSLNEIPFAFEQMGAEIYGSMSTALLNDTHYLREAVYDQMTTNTQGPMVWAQGYGAWGRWSGDGNAAEMTRDLGGFFVGLEGPVAGELDEALRVGFVAGYGHANYDVHHRSSSGYSNLVHLGAYGTWQRQETHLLLGAAYAASFNDVDRTVRFGDIYEDPSSNYLTNLIQLFAVGRYDWDTSLATLSPILGLAFVSQSAPTVNEKGGITALRVRSDTSSLFYTTLGAEISKDWLVAGRNVETRLSTAWQHVAGNTNSSTDILMQGTNQYQQLFGVSSQRDQLLVDATVQADLSSRASLSLSYAGQYGSDTYDNAFQGQVKLQF
ncbi:autotransporter outer membrane beta-barrel domain-containing protein [Flexibacterium corallicola]|uniref:autotransporter outer membrane beta-barrel domain-containing protein n=1 Tax=Flexibacterium corallicola TaxID=3037259 RepID=UPI00286EFF22|nr:autotransporter domain-containing protein [Pseudovibrio sp. M1P-2-3]